MTVNAAYYRAQRSPGGKWHATLRPKAAWPLCWANNGLMPGVAGFDPDDPDSCPRCAARVRAETRRTP